MDANELRQRYLEFFEQQQHLRLPSDSLVPDDPSLLFTSAGMVQFKPYFLGVATPPRPRVATVQKCLRTTDIDSVGDSTHLTFFEMLGNFSFGDYFKREAIGWAWTFLTEWLNIQPERLRITVFQDDQEAYDIWTREVGVPAARVFRFGEKSNYWPANAISEGPNGVCGPCSEIFYDTQSHLPPTPDGVWDDDRWMEIWNLVFTQFDRGDGGTLTPLPRRNIDTGMGLERTAAVLAGMPSVYHTDVFAGILARIGSICGQQYGGTQSSTDAAFRVIADHARATTCCIADGVLPANEGRGYVLRRLLRRAVLKGSHTLQIDRPFLSDVADSVIESLGSVYPELNERRGHVLNTIEAEENRFLQTLHTGSQRLYEFLSTPQTVQAGLLSGADAFTLYDTYGFPLELTEEMAAERDITVDHDAFDACMQEQRTRARRASAISSQLFTGDGNNPELALAGMPPTRFLGYDQLELATEVAAVWCDNGLVSSIDAPASALVVTCDTPFYAHSGGQVSDTGTLTGMNCQADVLEAVRTGDWVMHRVTLHSGSLQVGGPVTLRVHADRRMDIMRNHTATHLLQAALRAVLGSHVHQAGSLVDADRLRFDFTHPASLTDEQVRDVEWRVNEWIWQGIPTQIDDGVPIDVARSRGAMALFGEKYGDTVRVVEVPSVSVELCGGTHLSNTAQTGLFHITSEAAVAAGIRRIEAVTGRGAYQQLRAVADTLHQAAQAMRCTPSEILDSIARAQEQRRHLEAQIQDLRARLASGSVQASTATIAGLRVRLASLEGTDAATMAELADHAIQQPDVDVVVVCGESHGKALFTVKADKQAVSAGFHAGNLVRELAKIAGGGGGGRPDFAQAGGKDASQLAAAAARVPDIIETILQR